MLEDTLKEKKVQSSEDKPCHSNTNMDHAFAVCDLALEFHMPFRRMQWVFKIKQFAPSKTWCILLVHNNFEWFQMVYQ